MSGNSTGSETEPQIVDVTITAPDGDWLRQHCAMLIEQRLAASANIIPAIDSIYRWQGEIEHATEAYAIVHTRLACVSQITQLTVAGHPYVTPHVIAKPVVAGNPDYLTWVDQCTTNANS